MRTNGRSQRKNRGKQARDKKPASMVKGEVIQKVNEIIEDWGTKLNALNDRFGKIVEAVGKQFGIIEGNTKVHADCIQHLDLQQSVTSKVLQDAYHRIQVLEQLMLVGDDATPTNPEEVKRKADEIFTQVVENSFRAVREEQAAEQSKKLEDMLEAEKEAAKTSEALEKLGTEEPGDEEEEEETEETEEEQETEEEEDDEDEDEDDVEESSAEEVTKKEADVAADALRSAETPELMAEGPGGPGSDIPPKAEVFGD